MAVNSDDRRQYVYGIFRVVILVCVFILIVSLFRVTVARYYWQLAEENLSKNNVSEAVNNISGTVAWLPRIFFVNDLIRLNILKGDISFKQAEVSPDIGSFLEKLLEAEQYYRRAAGLDPLNIDAFTGLARSVSSIERVFPFVRKVPYTKKALPLFQYLLNLMPANIYTRTLFIQYCHKNKLSSELVHTLGDTLSIYPPLYFQLKNQVFYSPAMHKIVRESLLRAAHGRIYPAAAYKGLSDLSSVEGDYKAALKYYQQVMPYWNSTDLSGYYLSLGRLYCKAGMFPEAENDFLLALNGKSEDKLLSKIWYIYRNESRWNEFMAFIQKVKDRCRPSDIVEILSARCLIKMNRYELATSHLLRVSSPRYKAESLYLQARIAELRKNWDEMELKIQRATVLNPENTTYHLTFSRSLQRQKKWLQAEKEATQAIYSSSRMNPWLYNHRAWIRWNMKNYSGALSDWEQSTEISPQTADFYYNLAMAYEKGNNLYEAVKKIEKALRIKPGNKKYLNKKAILQKKLKKTEDN